MSMGRVESGEGADVDDADDADADDADDVDGYGDGVLVKWRNPLATHTGSSPALSSP